MTTPATPEQPNHTHVNKLDPTPRVLAGTHRPAPAVIPEVTISYEPVRTSLVTLPNKTHHSIRGALEKAFDTKTWPLHLDTADLPAIDKLIAAGMYGGALKALRAAVVTHNAILVNIQ